MKAAPMVIARSFKLERDAPHDEVVELKVACEKSFEAELQRYVVLGWRIAPRWEQEREMGNGMHVYTYRGRPMVQVDSNGDPVERMQ